MRYTKDHLQVTETKPAAVAAIGNSIDGRTARRERNRSAVIDTVLELFADEMVMPTAEAVAERSGLSLRSIYRYFEDRETLIQAAVLRCFEDAWPLYEEAEVGGATTIERIERFVAARLRLFEAVAPTFWATSHFAPLSPPVRDGLETTRERLREQFERQFAPELDALGKRERRDALAACDTLTQWDGLDFLRRHRGFSVAETEQILRRSLAALLAAAG